MDDEPHDDGHTSATVETFLAGACTVTLTGTETEDPLEGVVEPSRVWLRYPAASRSVDGLEILPWTYALGLLNRCPGENLRRLIDDVLTEDEVPAEAPSLAVVGPG